MKKAVHLLIAGCLAGAIGMMPAAFVVMTPAVEAAPALATITGTVMDEAGKPLIGAIVALLEPHSRGKELASVKTNVEGKFTAAIAPGAYRLRATAEGFSSMLTRINLDRSGKVTYNFALKRTDTLVQKRGDSDDYRWIARSVPRHVMNLRPDPPAPAIDDTVKTDSFTAPRPTFHGMAQFLAAQSSLPGGQGGPNFFGVNFAVAGSLDGNIEMALIGQRGAGQMAPQRLTAITSMRTSHRHQITASVAYGQIALSDRHSAQGTMIPASLDQLSVAALGSWQVAQPLLVIYGFDYSSFIGSAARQRDSILPRFAVQYSPRPRWNFNAAVTPGRSRNRQSIDEFKTENIQANLEIATPEIAFTNTPLLDRSRRYEMGVEKIFGEGESALETSAFYDIISGHGVGIMALPLEVSPETQEAFQQIAHQVSAMNGAARGARVMFQRHLSDRVTASFGYSAGSGSQFRNASIESLKPAQMFRGGFFQVATAKLDLDLSDRSGTRVSTVIRLSPSAVVFAIDPFAGRMSVYDPNINVYVTQELPSFGLPVQWQAIVDLRNLLNQIPAVEDGSQQLLATRTSRTIRGGLAFRW